MLKNIPKVHLSIKVLLAHGESFFQSIVFTAHSLFYCTMFTFTDVLRAADL